MKKLLYYFWCTCVPLVVHAQNESVKSTLTTSILPEKESFESYCLENALSVVTIPVSKSHVEISGNVVLKQGKATYKDYAIELKEEQTQYFTIEGSDKLLVVQSLYRLRLDYNNQHTGRL